jgi:predicted transcriptional regulator
LSDETVIKERKEKDITIAFKGSREIKDKIDELAAMSCLEKKEWLEHAISLYELEILKKQEGISKFEGDIEALGEHSRRINEIFKALVEKVLDDQKRHKSYLSEIMEERNKTIKELEFQISELTSRNFKLSNDLCNADQETNELRRQLSHLEELNETRKKEIERLSASRSDSERLQKLEYENTELSRQLELLKTQHEAEMYKLQKEAAERQIDEIKKLLISSQLPSLEPQVHKIPETSLISEKAVIQSVAPFEATEHNLQVDGILDENDESPTEKYQTNPPKRGRGRPRGSKNKNGKEETEDATVERTSKPSDAKEVGSIYHQHEDDTEESNYLVETVLDASGLESLNEDVGSDDTENGQTSPIDYALEPESDEAILESNSDFDAINDLLEYEVSSPEHGDFGSEAPQNDSIKQLTEEPIHEHLIPEKASNHELDSPLPQPEIRNDINGEPK